MTITQEKFNQLETLPFTDTKFVRNQSIDPIVFTLAKDPSKIVTLLCATSHEQVPRELIDVLHEEYNYVIEEGRTYPYHEPFDYDHFVESWFTSAVFILIEGDYSDGFANPELKNKLVEFWKEKLLGNFYVKPNYTGRCSHVCNGGFIVNHSKRGLGLGKELGKQYLIVAPQLGFVYSVFNLVFETNVASSKIWDSLGFEKIGFVKNVAVLKGENKLVGAIMYGKDLV